MLYRKIQSLCKKKGLSIAKVERETGLSNGAISKWAISVPTADKLLAVAKYLDTSVEYLMGVEPNDLLVLPKKERE